MAIAADRIYSLEGRGLKLTTAADIAPYIAELQAVENLEEVRLNGNTLGPEAAKALADVLRTKVTLKVATLYDIFTSRLKDEVKEGLVALCAALTELPELVEVDLSDNAFGPLGAEAMADFLSKHTQLQVLKLNNNGLGVQGGQTIANALLASQQESERQGKTPALHTIVCGRNRLENGSAPYFAKAYKALGTLREVRMPQNGIRPEGITELVAGLRGNPLKSLDLQDNTFTHIGSKALAEALAEWEVLEALNIGDCLLGATGGLLVIQALKSRASLKTVNLQYNEIEYDGALAMAEALAELSALERLELNGNRFDAESNAVELIKAALTENDLDDDVVLGSLSDMEELTDDEDESESEADEEKEAPTSAARAEEQLASLVDDMKRQLNV
ncbi:Ran GAP Rna1 [Coemansia sp. RSA 552]|nr:Ran GAP Rna1 [Coemansia sp. RSA 552]